MPPPFHNNNVNVQKFHVQQESGACFGPPVQGEAADSVLFLHTAAIHMCKARKNKHTLLLTNVLLRGS